MEPIKILLAEDHAVVRESIRESLAHESEFEVVGEASDGEEAVKLAKELSARCYTHGYFDAQAEWNRCNQANQVISAIGGYIDSNCIR